MVFRACLFFGVGVLCGISVAVGQEPAEGTLTRPSFIADFSRAEKLVSAVTAAGTQVAPVKVLHADEPTYDIDLMAHTVRGLMVGQGCASVSYPAVGHVPVGKGTIELTLKPVDWTGDDERVHMLLQTMVSGRTEFGKLFLYKYKESGLAMHFEFSDQGDRLFLRTPIPGWTAGSWHHVAVTYDLPGAVHLYMDGRQVAQGRVPRRPPWPDSFCVGPWSQTFGRAGRTTIGLVAMYPRALTPSDIQTLAAKRLPDLRDASSRKDGARPGEILGRRSPWIEAGRPRLALDALEPDTVPTPWTAVERRGASVSVWGRAYDFTGNGLLSSIRSVGGELLSGPIDVLTGEERLAFGAPIPVGEAAEGRLTFRREARRDGELAAVFEATVLYDGLVQCELRFAPGVPGASGELSLRVPLTGASSTFIHYVGAPQRYESQNLPRNSYSLALPKAPGEEMTTSFRTTLWIGDNRRGLLWCTESDQFWWPKERGDCIRIRRTEDGSAHLVIRLVTEPFPDAQVRPVYRFGLMATPVRPMPEGWRGWTFTAQYDGIKGKARGNHLIYWPDQWRFMGLDPDPHRAQNLDENRARNARDHAAGRSIIPYWSRLHHPAVEGNRRLPDVDEFRRQWATEPNRPGGGNHQIFRCSATTGWADYLVWCTREWPRIMGWMDGVYIDETQPIPNTRAASGGGYDSLAGNRRPTYEYQGSRAMYQRMMHIIATRNGTPARSIAHCSATHTMQCLSPFTIMLIGEQYYSGYFSNNPELQPPDHDRVYYYSYALPMDRLRAECYWRQWGMVMLWLPCLKNQKDIIDNPLTTRDMLSRVMQADMLVWPLFCNGDEVRKTWTFRREFGVADPGVDFVPYWENDLLTADRDGVVVGYYRNGERLLALVSNLSREPQTVTLDLSNLIPASVSNAETGEQLPCTGDTVTLNMRRNDYAALTIDGGGPELR